MARKISTIIFTSDLSNTSRVAFSQAALLANQLKAKLILLHVLEKMPEAYEAKILSLFGAERWLAIQQQHRDEARHALIGKITQKQMVRTALSEFCRENGLDDLIQGIPETEIIVEQGDVVEIILEQAMGHNCDMILLGADSGVFSEALIGNTIKSVMKRARIPTVIIPTNPFVKPDIK